MKIAVLATLVATASAFSINKADIAKVRLILLGKLFHGSMEGSGFFSFYDLRACHDFDSAVPNIFQ
jgi:hypothetical protein